MTALSDLSTKMSQQGFNQLDVAQIDALVEARDHWAVQEFHGFYKSDFLNRPIDMTMELDSTEIILPDFMSDLATKTFAEMTNGDANIVNEFLTFGLMVITVLPVEEDADVPIELQVKASDILTEFDVEKVLRKSSKKTNRERVPLEKKLVESVQDKAVYSRIQVRPVEKCLIFVRYKDGKYDWEVYTRPMANKMFDGSAQYAVPEKINNARVLYIPECVDGTMRLHSALCQVHPLLIKAEVLEASYVITTVAQARPSYQQLWPAMQLAGDQSMNREQGAFNKDLDNFKIAMASISTSITAEIAANYEAMKLQFTKTKTEHSEMDAMARIDPILKYNPLRETFANPMPLSTPPYPCPLGSRLELLQIHPVDPRALEKERSLYDDAASRYGLSMAFLRGTITRGDAITSQMESIKRFARQNLAILSIRLAEIMDIILETEVAVIRDILFKELSERMKNRHAALRMVKRLKLTATFMSSGISQISFADAKELGVLNVVKTPQWRQIVLGSLELPPEMAIKEGEAEDQGGPQQLQEQQQGTKRKAEDKEEKPKPKVEEKKEEVKEEEKKEEKPKTEDKKRKAKDSDSESDDEEDDKKDDKKKGKKENKTEDKKEDKKDKKQKSKASDTESDSDEEDKKGKKKDDKKDTKDKKDDKKKDDKKASSSSKKKDKK